MYRVLPHTSWLTWLVQLVRVAVAHTMSALYPLAPFKVQTSIPLFT